MLDSPYINMAKLSDDAIIKKIGDFVKNQRLEQNMTQQDLATKAGINRTTLSELELGRRCQLLTLIQVLRILNQLQLFATFEVEKKIRDLRKMMEKAAKELDFIEAARLRDELFALETRKKEFK
jgi:transcriptional regulator with XRE-family HTH domain